MADWYVRSGATGTGAGTSWGNACVSLAAVDGLVSSGDNIWVSHDHNSSVTGAVSIASGTGLPVYLYSVNDSANYASTSHSAPTSAMLTARPTYASASAKESSIDQILGNIYVYGLWLEESSYFTIGASGAEICQVFENCVLSVNAAGARSLNIGADATTTACHIEFCNVDINLSGGGAHNVSLQNNIVIDGGIYTGTNSLTFIGDLGARHHHAIIKNYDFTNLSAGYLYAGSCKAEVIFQNCKIPSGCAVITSATRTASCRVEMWASDAASGSRNRMEIYAYTGDAVTTTSVYRAGSIAATDYSIAVDTNAKCTPGRPFRIPLGVVYFDDTGDKTLTVYIAQKTGKTRATNADVWIETSTPDSASPIGEMQTTRVVAPCAAGTTLTTDSTSTWTGLTTPVLSEIALTIDAAGKQAGPILVSVCFGKDFSGADNEVYVDAEISLA